MRQNNLENSLTGFYWPTIFRDYSEWVKNCDICQRMGNINRRNEMSLQGIRWCKFLMCGDFM